MYSIEHPRLSGTYSSACVYWYWFYILNSKRVTSLSDLGLFRDTSVVGKPKDSYNHQLFSTRTCCAIHTTSTPPDQWASWIQSSQHDKPHRGRRTYSTLASRPPPVRALPFCGRFCSILEIRNTYQPLSDPCKPNQNEKINRTTDVQLPNVTPFWSKFSGPAGSNGPESHHIYSKIFG